MAEDLKARVLELVRKIAEAMGLSLEASITETGDGLRVDLEGESGELLLRRKGEALQALQHLVNAAFRHQLAENKRIAVDCMGFRRDKEAELRQMVHFLAERATRTGEEQTLGPLNPYDRRVVHLAVAEEGTVTSESIGDAFMKTVIIAPKKS